MRVRECTSRKVAHHNKTRVLCSSTTSILPPENKQNQAAEARVRPVSAGQGSAGRHQVERVDEQHEAEPAGPAHRVHHERQPALGGGGEPGTRSRRRRGALEQHGAHAREVVARVVRGRQRAHQRAPAQHVRVRVRVRAHTSHVTRYPYEHLAIMFACSTSWLSVQSGASDCEYTYTYKVLVNAHRMGGDA